MARVFRFLVRFWFGTVFLFVAFAVVFGALHKNSSSSKTEQRPLARRDATGAPEELPKTADALTVAVVLDTSGSMSGKVDGRAKIDIAQDVLLDDFVPLLGDDTYLALITFESDHGALRVEPRRAATMIKKRWTQREWVMEQIERAKPGAMTPIYACLRGTEHLLGGRRGRRVVVLITDGEETYASQEDVLRALDDAKAHGMEVFVIGFQLGSEGRYLENHLGLNQAFFRANGGRAGLQKALTSVLAAIER